MHFVIWMFYSNLGIGKFNFDGHLAKYNIKNVI